MERTIYSFSYDYVRQNGQYLVICLSQADCRQSLSPIALKMMDLVNIPSLLPYRGEQINLNCAIYYDIASKRMLAPLWRGSSPSPQQFLQLLLGVVSTVADSVTYLLNEHHYLLHEEFIFIGEDFNEVYLTYLPYAERPSMPTIAEQLERLVRNYLKQANGELAVEADELLVQLRQEICDIRKVKQAVTQLLYPSAEAARSSEPAIADLKELPETDAADDEPIETGFVVRREPVFVEKSVADKDDFRPLTFKENVLLAIPVLLVISLLWSMFIRHPQEFRFYFVMGGTLLLADIFFILSKIWRPRPAWKPAVPAPFVSDAAMEWPKESDSETDARTYFEELPYKTTVLAPSPLTTLLSPADALPVRKPPKTMLLIEHGDSNEKLPFGDGDHFVLGRGPDGVQYSFGDSGVSRLHAEIVRENNLYIVRDLGSRNGSFLNGEPLIPYKQYPFHEGDVLSIVQTEFRLKIE